MKVVIIADLSSTIKNSQGQSYIEKLYQIFINQDADVVIQCPASAVEQISKTVPSDKIMSEPQEKGTAAAIGLATAYLASSNPKELVVYIFANQNVAYQDRLMTTLKVANDMYKHLSRMLLVGVSITDPNSNYGYIKIGKVLQEISGLVAFELTSFERNLGETERTQANNSWRYLWDTGCMVCQAENLLEIYRDTQPEMFTGLMTIKASIGTKFEKEIVETVYSSFPKISMAKGVYEKIPVSKVAVIPVDLGISKNTNL